MVFQPRSADEEKNQNNDEPLFRSGKNEDLFHDA